MLVPPNRLPNLVQIGSEAGLPASTPRGNSAVPDDDTFWTVDGPWTMDDALRHQRAIYRTGLTFTRPYGDANGLPIQYVSSNIE